MKTDVKHSVIRKNKKTFKGTLALIGRFLLCFFVVYPLFYGWKGLSWFYHTFLTEVYESGNNGIYGPGYHHWKHRRFSTGNLALLIVIICILIYVISLIF